MKPAIKKMENTWETNTIWHEGRRGWCVFTSSLDCPKGWEGDGWKASSTCGLGYLTTVWETKSKDVVKRDIEAKRFRIEPEAFAAI